VIIRRILQFSCRNSLLVILVTVLATLAFGYFASRLRVNPDVESLIPENAAVRQLMNRYRQGGLSGEYLVVAVSSPDCFELAKLGAYDEALRRLEQLPELEPGVTPFNLITFEKKATRLAAVPLAPERRAPRTPEELELFRRRLAGTPYAANLVVSRDLTVLAAFFPAAPIRDFASLMRRVREITAPLEGHYRVYLSGSIPFVDRTGFYLSRDLTVLFAAAAGLILLFYFLAYRTVRGVLLPFLVVLVGTAWSLGLMSALGFSLTLLNIVTPPLLLTVGSSYGIHILNQYYRSSAAREAEWLAGALEEVSGTILWASLISIIGFASLVVTNIRQVREFAVVTSFGTVSCALLALFFFPAILSRLPPPHRRQLRRVRAGLLSGMLLRLSRFVIRRRWPIAGALGACALGFALSLPYIRTDTDTIGYFPRSDRVVQDMYFLTGKLGGFDELNLSLLAPEAEAGYFLRPEVLARVDAMEKRLAAIPDICYAVSFASYVRFLNQVASGEDRIPETRAPILLLSRFVRALAAEAGGSNPVAGLANEDFSRLTLSFRIYNSRTGKFINEQGLRDLLDGMKPIIAAGLPAEVRSELWGMGLQYLSLSDLLRSNLARSFGMSVLLVLAVAVLSFRSLRYGLLAVVPLVSGMMLNFLLMALARIPLDMTTIMVSSVAVGMGVDDAIHFILSYRRRRARVPGDAHRAVAVTLVVTGRPIFLTSLAIVAGLLVLVLSSFRPIVYFGILVAFTLAATCASTLVVLPALLALAPGKGRLTKKGFSGKMPVDRP
jgi:predicted RND superfamily exporter protein